MAVDYANAHAGFDHVGECIPDKLFDRNTRRRKHTIASGEGILDRGTLLGKVTATGKWRKSLAASNDGSEEPRGILLHSVDATAADVEAIVARSGDFAIQGVIFGAGHTAASVDDKLIDRAIYLEYVVGL